MDYEEQKPRFAETNIASEASGFLAKVLAYFQSLLCRIESQVWVLDSKNMKIAKLTV